MNIKRKLLYGTFAGLVMVTFSFLPYLKLIPNFVDILFSWAFLERYWFFLHSREITIFVNFFLWIGVIMLILSSRRKLKILGIIAGSLLLFGPILLWLGLMYLFVMNGV